MLHYSAEDDDRSAITLWVKWTKADGTDVSIIDALLLRLHGLMRTIP